MHRSARREEPGRWLTGRAILAGPSSNQPGIVPWESPELEYATMNWKHRLSMTILGVALLFGCSVEPGRDDAAPTGTESFETAYACLNSLWHNSATTT